MDDIYCVNIYFKFPYVKMGSSTFLWAKKHFAVQAQTVVFFFFNIKRGRGNVVRCVVSSFERAALSQ